MLSSGKKLAANAGGRGFESYRGHKNLFFTFYSIRVKCEKLFCKTNIKLLKLIQKCNRYIFEYFFGNQYFPFDKICDFSVNAVK